MTTHRYYKTRKAVVRFSAVWRRSPLNVTSVRLLILAGLLSSSLWPAALAVQVVGTTNTQAVLSYTAPDANACIVKVSENSSLSPLVYDVDPTLFSGSNLDSRTGTVISGSARIFISGKRATEQGADGKFYSRALQTYTTHYYQITCGSSAATGSFQTSNISLGNTYTDVPQVDPATGKAVVPTFPADRTTPVIDPQTGALVKRLWLPQDTSYHAIPFLNSGGQTRMCGYHLIGPGPGYLCYFPAYDGVVYYIIPTTGEVRFLGELWISGGSDFPGGGTTGVASPSLAIDANDSRVLYNSATDTLGQSIIVKGTYTGDYSAVPGASRASFTWENFTPGPKYYLSKLIQAFDPTFDPAKFGCMINAGGLNPANGHSYSLLQCNRAQQDSYGWVAAMDMGNGMPMDRCGSDPAQCPHIVGAINVVKNPQTRWCGLHNAKIIPDSSVMDLAFHGLTGGGDLGAGPYQVKLTQPIGPGDTTISVSGEPSSSNTVEPYLMDAAVGDVFILQGPTPEYISIVAKNSSTSWVVKRAFLAPEIWTAQPWPAGAALNADCENQVNHIPGQSGSWLEAYWKFLDDPRGTGAGYILDRYFGGSHADYQTNLRVAGGFVGVQGPLLSTIDTPLTFSISEDPTFAGVKAIADGNTYSDYPSYQQANAPPQEQNWFLATREFLGGSPYSAQQGAQLISGQLYEYAFATWWGTTGLRRKQVATIASSGGYNLTDISGPGSILSGTPADSYKYCVAQVAGECHAGSQPGNAFVNAPNVKYLICTDGNGSPNPANLDLCLADMSPDGHSAYQYGLLANSEGVTNGSWGAGYSRRLSSGFSGIKGEAPLFKPLPDGAWAFFDIYGFMMSSDPALAPGLVMIKMPPFVKSDSINRTTFLPAPLTIIPPAGQGIVSAGVEFGYGEQGLPGQYYCTSRREACLATASSVQDANPFNYEQTDTYSRMPCAASCSIPLPVLPGHVAYYRVKYYNAQGVVVAFGDKGVAAETAVSATVGAAIAPNPALGIAQTSTGNLTQGQIGAVFSVTVSNNVSAGPTSGTVTVTETAPAGLTLVSMAGSGWICSGIACTRNDALSASLSYPAIAVTLNVAFSAPSSVTNLVTVSGGNSAPASAGNTAVVAASLPGPGGSVAFVKVDLTTQGSWKSVYGSQGANVIGDNASYPSYVTVTPPANSYVWTASTSDVRAPLKLSSPTGRVAGCWYSSGVFTIDLSFTDGQTHQVAIYALDFDNSLGRSEKIEILNANGVLDTRTVSSFVGGQYLVWNLSGRVIVRVTNTNPVSNAVISGLFFGPAAPPPPVTFVKADLTTQGSWKSVYGSQGGNVIGDNASYPSYVAVTPSANASFVWAASTSDVRAPLKLSSPTGRVAGCWYSSGVFNIDLNFTDGQIHQVALYALDFDNNHGRSETIDILDANGVVLDTRTLSSFVGGQYLVWNLNGRVIVRVTNTNPVSNAVISALLFGPPV